MSTSQQNTEYPTRYQISKKRIQTVYLTWIQKKEIMAECGDAAVILFEFFLSKAGIRDYQYTDGKAGKVLGWKDSKVKKVRLKLRSAGYFYEESASYTHGRKVTTTYLGKQEVQKAKVA